MTAAELDRTIGHLRAAAAAAGRGLPALAALHDTIARATLYRAGLRYRDARMVMVIDRTIDRALVRGGGED